MSGLSAEQLTSFSKSAGKGKHWSLFIPAKDALPDYNHTDYNLTQWQQIQRSEVTEWITASNDSELWFYAMDSWNITAGRGLLMDLRVDGNEGIVLQFLTRERLERRTGQCNWIHPEAGESAFYCTRTWHHMLGP